MKNKWNVVVVVPAHNEAQLIGACLRSIRRAARRVRHLAHVQIIVVADHCSDETATVARRSLRGQRRSLVIEVQVASAGSARRAGVDAALAALAANGAPAESMWVANTDADSRVPADWLVVQLAAASSGIGAIAGIVRLDNDSTYSRQLQDVFDMSYTIRGDGTHDHVHGANLGLRGDLYVSAGGWPAGIATGEDHDLWNRVRHLKAAATLSTADLFVHTSTRRHARAPSGFAANLVNHDLALAVRP
jgi:glycosyltransferase involved in cell wall biosynthesis